MSDFEAAVASRVSAETWWRGIRAAPWFRLCNVVLQSFCGGRVTLPPQISRALLGRFSGSFEKTKIRRSDRSKVMILMQVKGGYTRHSQRTAKPTAFKRLVGILTQDNKVAVTAC